MKKFIFVSIGFILLSLCMVMVFVKNQSSETANAYLRIHIRANSNRTTDQDIKYKVKEGVINYLTPLIAEGSTFEQAYSILKDNLNNIEDIADKVLKENGFSYTSKASLKDEYFPTRSYGSFTLENGFYDALIIELGTGEGNNWWCVVYPPLCFIGGENTSGANIIYKSKLIEIVRKFFA